MVYVYTSVYDSVIRRLKILSKLITLKCRECGEEHSPTHIYTCPNCFGPLDVTYDYDNVQLSRDILKGRYRSLWRYLELLPITKIENIVDLGAGYTPLQKCKELGRRVGLRNLFIKNDTVNPTYSFKDRPASVAISKSLEFRTGASIGCPSTGNLAAATAAHAAKAGLPCYVFIPECIEANKIAQTAAYGARIIKVKGTYDESNRLAFQAAELYNLDIVNINLRPYYVEGSKTLAFEVCEQLDWAAPDRVIVPTGSGAMLCAIEKGFREFEELDLIEEHDTKLVCTQAEGCAPIVESFNTSSKEIHPIEKPNTVAYSLAIGDPGDGVYALRKIRESGGSAESSTDKEIVDAIRLLAQTEGIFAEPAGGVSVAVLKKLAERGEIDPDERVVCYVTGSGLKSPEVLSSLVYTSITVEPRLQALAEIMVRGEI